MNFYIKSLHRPRAGMVKILLVMKLIILLLTTAILQVSASTFAQKLSYTKKGASLEQIFAEIQKQTGYFVIYAEDKVDKHSKLDVNFKSTDLKDVLDVIAKSQNLTYSFNENNIGLKPKEPSFLARVASAFAAIDVTGRVVDESGTPLPGATIKVKRKNQVTKTNSEGEFRLTGVDEDAMIEISFVGYAIKEVKAARNLGVITLEMSNSNLEEVNVSTGYWTTSKKLSVGNIAKVKGEDIRNQPVGNVMQALIGRMAGVSLVEQIGIPGRIVTVQIRGRNSINNSSDPLYIVDGVPFFSGRTFDTPNMPGSISSTSALNTLNPADIESIEILKDADATAIYGSRGANGVIRITTRKGRIGKTEVDININKGIGQAAKKWDLLNGEQYYAMRREAFKNDGVTTLPSTAYDLNGRWDMNRFTDWQEILIGRTAQYTDIQGSVSGGNVNTQFRLAGGYNKQTTILPGKSYDRRTAVSANISHQSVNNCFKINGSASYSVGNSLLPQINPGAYILLPPNAPAIYDANGALNWEGETWTNPFAELLREAKNRTNYVNANLNLSYSLMPGIIFQSNLGYTNTQGSQFQKMPRASYAPSSSNTAEVSQGNNTVNIWTAEPQINYNKSSNFGRFEALVGATFTEQTQQSSAIRGVGFSSDALLNNIQLASAISLLGAGASEYRYIGVYGRFNYNYQDKYLLNVTIRRDGSSRFGPDKRFSNFSAIGLGWVISKEKWMQKLLSFINYAKVRGSYGVTGNDGIGDYQYLDTYASAGSTPYLGIIGLSPNRLFNSEYAWERNRKLEAGVELGFIQSRILFSASFFNNRSSNQLLTLPLPAITGNSGILANLPAIVQNTGLELEINTTNFNKRSFRWNSSINFTLPNNKLIAYPNLAQSTNANTLVVGESLFITKKYQYLNTDPTTGLYNFQDIDGNGVISGNQDRQAIIRPVQQYYGGLSNSFNYKGITLDIFCQFLQQKYGANYRLITSRPGTRNNQPVYVLDRWQANNNLTDIQRFSNSNSAATTAHSNMTQSSLGYSDASYVRIKNVSLAYTLPKKLVERLGIRSLQFFTQAQNLITFTKYQGLDPETKGLLPALRTLSGGARLGL